MKNVWIIIKKELRNYFNQPTAYILLVVFLVLAYFFYFRLVFLTGEVSLRPLFNIMPWLLMFFVPAIAMNILAKEKDSGTLEILATQPVSIIQILVGKFLGTFIFIMAAGLITLTIPITLSRFGNFDWGIIVGQYIGLMFLAASFLSIGRSEERRVGKECRSRWSPYH